MTIIFKYQDVEYHDIQYYDRIENPAQNAHRFPLNFYCKSAYFCGLLAKVHALLKSMREKKNGEKLKVEKKSNRKEKNKKTKTK